MNTIKEEKFEMKKKILFAIFAIAMLSQSMTVFAAPKKMPDGTMFDAAYYAATYPDVKAAFGNDVELRTLKSFEGNTLTFAKVTGITAGVPCLIKVSKVAENNTYTFTGVSVKAIKDKAA